MSRTLRPVLAAVVAVLVTLLATTVVLVTAGGTTATAETKDGTATAAPDRIVLSPTTEPATSQAITWRTATSILTGGVEIAPAADPQAITYVGAGSSTVEQLPGSRLVARHHTAIVTDLSPDTAYRYRVGSGAGWSDWAELTTAPTDPGTPWTFLYFGDAQLGLDAGWAQVADAAFARHPEARASLHAGDLVNDGNDDGQWQAWFTAMAPYASTRTLLTVPGNHELYGDPDLERYRSQFSYPDNGPTGFDERTWFTDLGGVRFVTLDGNIAGDAAAGRAQAAWLDRVLEENPMTWTVVSVHQPMFSAAKLRDNVDQREAWLDILEEHDVDLVLQGHDHAYARGHVREDGPVYVVTNAGDKYYDLDPPDRNNWTINGAVRDAAADKISSFQSIRVEADRLVYRSYVGVVGPEATPADARPGDVLDAFSVVRDADGTTRVVDERG